MEENNKEKTGKYEIALFTTGNLDVLNDRIQRFLGELLSTRFKGMVERQYKSLGFIVEGIPGCRIVGKKFLRNRLHLLLAVSEKESINDVVSQIVCAICIGIRGRFPDYLEKWYGEFPCIWSREFGCSALEDGEFEKKLKEWEEDSDIAQTEPDGIPLSRAG